MRLCEVPTCHQKANGGEWVQIGKREGIDGVWIHACDQAHYDKMRAFVLALNQIPQTI